VDDREICTTVPRLYLLLSNKSIDGNSVVVITASEFNTVGVDPHHRFMGDADVWVSNIAPHGPPADPNHGVEWILHLDFPNDINVLIDITVLDSRVVPG
jgi:hypothetical protein